TREALGAIQLCGSASTRASPRRYFMRTPERASAQMDKGFGRPVQGDVGVVEQVDQLHHHDRREPPDLELLIAITGHVPAAPQIVDAMSDLALVLAEEAQRHLEDGS